VAKDLRAVLDVVCALGDDHGEPEMPGRVFAQLGVLVGCESVSYNVSSTPFGCPEASMNTRTGSYYMFENLHEGRAPGSAREHPFRSLHPTRHDPVFANRRGIWLPLLRVQRQGH
jgi:hypothetical protein